MKVNYNLLKNAIIRAAKAKEKGSIGFTINPDELAENLKQNEVPLTVVPSIGMDSAPVKMEDVLYLSEFFKGEKLSWISEEKQFTTIVFALKSEESDSLIEAIETEPDEDIDRVNAISELIANYPCYIVSIVSYVSNDPKRIGKPSYEIKCRANTVSIKMEKSEE